MKKVLCLLLILSTLGILASCNKAAEKRTEIKSLTKVEALLQQMEDKGLFQVDYMSQSESHAHVSYLLADMDYELTGTVSKLIWVEGKTAENEETQDCVIIECENMLDADMVRRRYYGYFTSGYEGYGTGLISHCEGTVVYAGDYDMVAFLLN